MFVVDISYQGDTPYTETVFVRRPYVTIGPDDPAHVVIPEFASLQCTLGVSRQLGRRFTVTKHTLNFPDDKDRVVENRFNGSAKLVLGPVALNITALDVDLIIRENEALDRAGVRILRRALSDHVPDFPAVLVTAPHRALVSFSPDQPLSVGRSRHSGVRFDVTTVSQSHARVGFESGEFWVEDLGSTNGTFVGDRQVASRISVPAGVPIHFGTSATIIGVLSQKQIAEVGDPSTIWVDEAEPVETRYPCLLSLSEAVRPSRLALKEGAEVILGRDPSSHMWLGAPHVSRRHCLVTLGGDSNVTISDTSSNGTVYDRGVLRTNENFETDSKPTVLDFGGGVTVALCFTEEHEQSFKEKKGIASAFAPAQHSAAATRKRAYTPRERRTTTWFNVQDERFQNIRMSPGVRGSAIAMFKGLTVPGRIAIALVGLGFAGLMIILGAMIVSGFGW